MVAPLTWPHDSSPMTRPRCSSLYALVKDGRRIYTGGLLQGFDAATWMVIALQVRAAGRPVLISCKCLQPALACLGSSDGCWPCCVQHTAMASRIRPLPTLHTPAHSACRRQVFGGLVTGMVVKYCDNILKNFALAISVILTVLVAIPLFGQVRIMLPLPLWLLVTLAAVLVRRGTFLCCGLLRGL